jgi:Uma2 family endonuclease
MPTLPMSRPLTLDDFEAIRDVDDGHRYELIDGVLIVTLRRCRSISGSSASCGWR